MNKILTYNNYQKTINHLKDGKTKIILVGGCFDIIHAAHLEFLNKSKSLGGKLIIMLESDESVKKRKGKNRPINSQLTRAHALSQILSVDSILLLPILKTDSEYVSLVKTIEPDIIAVTAGDPFKKMKDYQAKLIGGRVVEVMTRDPKHSTSALMET